MISTKEIKKLFLKQIEFECEKAKTEKTSIAWETIREQIKYISLIERRDFDFH